MSPAARYVAPTKKQQRDYLARYAQSLSTAVPKTEWEAENIRAEIRRTMEALAKLLTRSPRSGSMFAGGMNEDMGRRRSQRTGHLYKKGPSWILRWREDIRDAEGNIARVQLAQAIAPVVDPATGRRVTKPEAQRIAWEDVLSHLDAATLRPQSLLTVAEFCRNRFEPDRVKKLKPSGQAHYGTAGDPRQGAPAHGQLKAVIESLGNLTLRQVRPEHVQAALDARLKAGAGVQTATHLKNAISAVFRHAIALNYYGAPNPAAVVSLPEMERQETHALSAAEAAAVLAQLPRGTAAGPPVYEMVLLSVCASLNIAELLALRWRRLNLSPEPLIVEGEALAPYAARIAENNYRGKLSSPKTPARRRTVPLAPPVVDALMAWHAATKWNRPEDFVFSGARSGRPLNENNLRARVLAPAGVAAGLSFPLSWHVFRHTHSTLAEQIDIPLSERQATMGHSSARMTLHYTHADLERRREGLAQLADLIAPEKEAE